MKIRITFEGKKKTCMDILFYLGIISIMQLGFAIPFIFTDDTIGFVKGYVFPLLAVLCICISIVSIMMQFADDEKGD